MDFEYQITEAKGELMSLCYVAYKSGISIPKLSEWSGIPQKDIEDYIRQDIQILWDDFPEHHN